MKMRFRCNSLEVTKHKKECNTYPQIQVDVKVAAAGITHGCVPVPAQIAEFLSWSNTGGGHVREL